MKRIFFFVLSLFAACFIGCGSESPIQRIVSPNTPIAISNSPSFQIPALDIGLNQNGTMWCIGRDNYYPSGDHQIFKWTGSGWTVVNGGGVRIDVAADGTPWLVNAAGTVYVRQNSGTGNVPWINMGGNARDIGVGADGSVWIIGKDRIPGTSDYKIFKLVNGVWTQSNGGGVYIDVLDDGRPAIINNAYSVYIKTGNSLTSAWQQIPNGSGKDIAADHQQLDNRGNNHATYGICIIGMDNKIYEYCYSTLNNKWEWSGCAGTYDSAPTGLSVRFISFNNYWSEGVYASYNLFVWPDRNTFF
jgi:hypothetical protein